MAGAHCTVVVSSLLRTVSQSYGSELVPAELENLDPSVALVKKTPDPRQPQHAQGRIKFRLRACLKSACTGSVVCRAMMNCVHMWCNVQVSYGCSGHRSLLCMVEPTALYAGLHQNTVSDTTAVGLQLGMIWLQLDTDQQIPPVAAHT